jgi:uncharacterized RDD family membrane protein YckC
MSSMPQRDGPDQWASAQQSAPAGDRSGTGPQPGSGPGQQDFGSTPAGSIPGQHGMPGEWAGQPGSMSPVNQAETRVTGRRVVQYLIDAFLVSIIPSLVSIPFDASNSTVIHVIGGLVAFVLFVLIGLWYWVIWPYSHKGQTFGMKLLSLRVISKNGGPASLSQLFIRWICLIFDAIPYSWPFTGLVGFVVILGSRYRQRIGDHLAKTLVISTGTTTGRRGGMYRSPSTGQQQQYESSGQM